MLVRVREFVVVVLGVKYYPIERLCGYLTLQYSIYLKVP